MKNIERALLIEVKSLLHELSTKERELTVYFFDLESKEEPELSVKQKSILQNQNSLCTPFFQKLTFSEKVKCVICHELFDPHIMFEGDECFTCAIDKHFEELKNT